MDVTKTHAVHGGTLRYLRHDSAVTGTPMTLSVFVPPGEGPFPVLIWLSGLTCTEDNFTTKAGAYRAAADHGVIIVAPDTSPRGDGVAEIGRVEAGRVEDLDARERRDRLQDFHALHVLLARALQRRAKLARGDDALLHVARSVVVALDAREGIGRVA